MTESMRESESFTAADDPGYLASLTRGPELLRAVRILPLPLIAALLMILALVPSIIGSGRPSSSVAAFCLVVTVLGLTGTGLSRVVSRRRPAPLAPGVTAEEASAAASAGVRSATFTSLVCGEPVALLGFVFSVVSKSPWPCVVGVAFAAGLLVASLPTTARIESVRRRLESEGATVPLWDVLLSARAADRNPHTPA